MILFRAGKRHGAGSTPGSYSEIDEAVLGDATGELGVRRGIVAIDAAAEDGDGPPARFERATVCLAVDTTRHAAHDDESGSGELAGERSRHAAPVGRARPGTDDGDRRLGEHRRVRRAPQEELRRRVVDRREQRRERRIAAPNPSDLAHAAGRSPGMRYESDSAT